MATCKKMISMLLAAVMMVLIAPQAINQSEAYSIRVTYRVTIKTKNRKPKLDATSLEIQEGDTDDLTLLNSNKNVKWMTNNKKVISLKKKGNFVLIKAKKPGKAVVTASYKGKKYKCKIKVKAKQFECKDTSLVIKGIGAYESTQALFDGIQGVIRCTTDDPGIAVVDSYDQYGSYGAYDITVKGVNYGTTNLRIFNNLDDKCIVIPITVKDVFSVSQEQVTFTELNQTVVLDVRLADCEGEYIKYFVPSASDVAKVSLGSIQNGVAKLSITSKEKGRVNITLSNTANDKRLTVQVNVNV